MLLHFKITLFKHFQNKTDIPPLKIHCLFFLFYSLISDDLSKNSIYNILLGGLNKCNNHIQICYILTKGMLLLNENYLRKKWSLQFL